MHIPRRWKLGKGAGRGEWKGKRGRRVGQKGNEYYEVEMIKKMGGGGRKGI